MEFPAEIESLDLSENEFVSVPEELSNFRSLKSVNLSQNPIESLAEFTFNGDSEKFENLEEVLLEDCDQLAYVDDAAFAYLQNLKNVSFKNSALFYLRKGVKVRNKIIISRASLFIVNYRWEISLRYF